MNNLFLKPIVVNVCRCSICGSPADRYENRFECQSNPGHMADTMTGIFSDCSYGEVQPNKDKNAKT